ncbi:MAG: TIM barrel protein [Gammaproteobacteria bacterium]|nr:TIM barrel protein [Gammaproteobacteria bacterium]
MSIMLGTTIYSMTNEWLAGQFTLPQLIDEVGKRKLGPGLEMIGFQNLRGFPHAVDKQELKDFLDAVERNELTLTSLAGNADIALNPKQWMDTEQSVEYMRPQIELAGELGFPVMRIQIGLTPEVLAKLEPIAAKAKVKLGMEIHAPEGPNTPKVMATREVYEKIDSEYLGFVPDFSSCMRAIPPGMLDKLTQAGLSQEGKQLLISLWEGDGHPFQRYMAFAQQAKDAGEPELPILQAKLIFTMFGRQQPEEWADILDRTVHIHAKFYEVNEDCTDSPSIDHSRILPIFDNADRTISMSSEWEGHAFWDADEVCAFEMVRRHHRLCERLLNR